mgnify:CR=1 FL=1
MFRRVPPGILVCALLLGSTAALPQDAPPADIAQLSLKDLNGHPQSLQAYRGQIDLFQTLFHLYA